MSECALDPDYVARLELAALLAPSVRGQDEKTLQRRVGLLDKDGNVVGETTWGVVLRSQVARHALEIAPAEGVRPDVVICESCGRDTDVNRTGPIRRFCGPCRTERACKVCQKPLSRTAVDSGSVHCLPCARAATRKPKRHCLDCRATLGKTRSERCRRCSSRHNASLNVKTHCKRGHQFSPLNTRISPQGRRVCRVCARMHATRPDTACTTCGKALRKSRLCRDEGRQCVACYQASRRKR